MSSLGCTGVAAEPHKDDSNSLAPADSLQDKEQARANPEALGSETSSSGPPQLIHSPLRTNQVEATCTDTNESWSTELPQQVTLTAAKETEVAGAPEQEFTASEAMHLLQCHEPYLNASALSLLSPHSVDSFANDAELALPGFDQSGKRRPRDYSPGETSRLFDVHSDLASDAANGFNTSERRDGEYGDVNGKKSCRKPECKLVKRWLDCAVTTNARRQKEIVEATAECSRKIQDGVEEGLCDARARGEIQEKQTPVYASGLFWALVAIGLALLLVDAVVLRGSCARLAVEAIHYSLRLVWLFCAVLVRVGARILCAIAASAHTWMIEIAASAHTWTIETCCFVREWALEVASATGSRISEFGKITVVFLVQLVTFAANGIKSFAEDLVRCGMIVIIGIQRAMRDSGS